MNVIDLTHTISVNMPVYPGTEAPSLSVACTVEKNGFKETLLHMFSHTGTHMDAPAHMFKNGTPLDVFEASQFVGSAVVIDCTELNEGERIGMTFIERCRELTEKADFLLFRTGWDKKWGTAAYFGDFPCISPEVADFIVDTGKKGVGLDVISIDPITGSGFDNHRKLLSQNTIVIIENLCNLDTLGSGLFTFIAAPLKFENADGAPVRAFAVKE
ncbi:MAG: hydrolase [Firmicutes bacterium HGW-Firmicutes-16]|nr:MAG: hydrolase [Firmicutes bacterium HGW-Firmicutes-16]